MRARTTQHGFILRPQDGVINVVAVGAETAELVAAPGDGYAVQLLSYVFTLPAGATVTWKSGSTAKSGPMKPSTGISAPTSGPAGRQLQCAENEALNLTVDTAGQYAGHFLYKIVEVA